MRIGFTGTRRGMTEAQKRAVATAFADRNPRKASELHHGDCIGADNDAHALGRVEGLYIIIHPPIDTLERAFAKGDETRPRAAYLARNRAIVDETDELIATPSGMTEVLRSGTWATIRYARKVGKPLLIIFPDGSTALDP